MNYDYDCFGKYETARDRYGNYSGYESCVNDRTVDYIRNIYGGEPFYISNDTYDRYRYKVVYGRTW